MWVNVKKYLLAQELELVIGKTSHQPGADLLDMTPLGAAFVTGDNYTNIVSPDSFLDVSSFIKAHRSITAAELENMKGGMVILVEFEVEYGISKEI